MERVLCSDNFKSFFEQINKIGLTLEEISGLVKKNLPMIAKDIKLGKMTVSFFSDPMPFEKCDSQCSLILYSNQDGCEMPEKTYEFHTGDGGRVIFTVQPGTGYCWTKAELAEIEFLCEIIFVICGRSRLSDVIQKLVLKDVNTGLSNINGFMASGNQLFANGLLHEYTAMFLNLKNFKYVNRRIGDKSVDEVIKKYAKILQSNLMEDESVARLGGDNFTLLVKKERKKEILTLLSGIGVELELSGVKHSFNIEARVGAYDIEHGKTMHYVMNCISTALGAAKRNSLGDVVFFNQEIMKKLASEQEMEEAFPEAIRSQEFVVYYQPKVDLQTNSMCGGEALVRWFKDGELVPPGEFVPLFERNGNICIIDFYVLEHVCQAINQWKEAGIEPLTISVNFSKTHLHEPDIAERILAVLEKYKIESKYIEIELTEMSDYSDYEVFKSLVTQMKTHGVKTSIDDFGTGYSSLNLLTDFMFDYVKLDKAFLDNIIKNNSKTDEIVVRNIVKMIQELDLKSVAEGVETTEQAQFLKNIGCTIVQGYLFDRPLPEHVFRERLKVRKY